MPCHRSGRERQTKCSPRVQELTDMSSESRQILIFVSDPTGESANSVTETRQIGQGSIRLVDGGIGETRSGRNRGQIANSCLRTEVREFSALLGSADESGDVAART
jgi:hypothetical protein